ncbi:MAG TPA: lasso peptide biosynthesis B2 protein [Candidatus Acidoferrales bacterium]|nr:lasso peptide biosynthesis B2 protein [Candidatus Acidoferrales bacterium]
MGRLGRFRRLSGDERWLLVQSMALLPVTAVALRLGGFRRWQGALRRLAPRGEAGPVGCPEASVAHGKNVASILRVASRYSLCRTNCLEQSLVLWWLLLRRGVPVDLRIGVRKAGGGLKAHAWVQLGGVILNDTEDVHQHYAPFDRDIAAVAVEER